VGDKTEEVTTIEGTVNNNRVEVEWEVEDYNETETETEAAATATPTDEATDVRPEKTAPRIKDIYWVDEVGNQSRDFSVETPVTLCVMLVDGTYNIGSMVELEFEGQVGENIRSFDIAGTVDANGIIKIDNFKYRRKEE
jgi:hypothetical protein